MADRDNIMRMTPKVSCQKSAKSSSLTKWTTKSRTMSMYCMWACTPARPARALDASTPPRRLRDTLNWSGSMHPRARLDQRTPNSYM